MENLFIQPVFWVAIIAMAALCIFGITWSSRRANRYKNILLKNAHEFDRIREDRDEWRRRQQSQSKILAYEKAEREKWEKEANGLAQTQKLLESQNIKLEAKIDDLHHSSENMVENYHQQVGALSDQVAEKDRRVAQLQSLLESLQQAANPREKTSSSGEKLSKHDAKQFQKLTEKLEKEQSYIAKLKDQLGEIKRELATSRRKYEELDVKTVGKLKHKIKQYEKLYLSMRGLKEMQEERNANWEIALRQLAVFAIQSGGKRVDGQLTLGELVSKALKAAGLTIGDEHLLESQRKYDDKPDDPAAPHIDPRRAQSTVKQEGKSQALGKPKGKTKKQTTSKAKQVENKPSDTMDKAGGNISPSVSPEH